MLAQKLQLDIVTWAKQLGWKCENKTDLKYHALRWLSEVAELCIACNANIGDMIGVVLEEHEKAVATGSPIRPHFDDPMDTASIQEELADSTIQGILFGFANFELHNYSTEEAVALKLKTLKKRTHVVSPEGVIYRKKGTPK